MAIKNELIMNNTFYILIAMVCLILTASVPAQTEPQGSAGITIIGDQELPQVLYIVPWKASTMPRVAVPKMSSLDQQLLLPCQLGKPTSNIGHRSSRLWPCKNHNVTSLAIEK